MAHIVALDYGHGGNDSGAVANGLVEKILNRKIGYQVRDLLTYNDIKVVELAGDEDTYVSLKQRSDKERASGADICVSIHNNAGGGQGAELIHSIYSKPGKGGNKLANCIANEIKKHQNIRRIFSRQGSSGGDFYHMIRETKSSAVIIEYGFVDNPTDAAKLKQDAFLEQMAKDTARGICNYFGVAYKEPQPKPVAPPKPATHGAFDGVVHRIIVDGQQIGAFDNAESIADLVEKYIASGTQNITIDRI